MKDVKPGDLICILAIVDEVKSWGVIGRCTNGGPGAVSGEPLRVRHSKYEVIGRPKKKRRKELD